MQSVSKLVMNLIIVHCNSSMWVTSNTSGPPHIHISNSYGTACQAQDPTQTLTDYGEIEIGESYHIIIDTNYTFTTVSISNSDDSKTGIYPFPRAKPTLQDHIGRTANVYFMSGKFSQYPYNRGNGTFSNIVITSSIFTAVPTTVCCYYPLRTRIS